MTVNQNSRRQPCSRTGLHTTEALPSISLRKSILCWKVSDLNKTAVTPIEQSLRFTALRSTALAPFNFRQSLYYAPEPVRNRQQGIANAAGSYF